MPRAPPVMTITFSAASIASLPARALRGAGLRPACPDRDRRHGRHCGHHDREPCRRRYEPDLTRQAAQPKSAPDELAPKTRKRPRGSPRRSAINAQAPIATPAAMTTRCMTSTIRLTAGVYASTVLARVEGVATRSHRLGRKISCGKHHGARFPRLLIAHRITPHGRRGNRLQRTLSEGYRADREALDRGGRKSAHPRTRALQPAAGRHPGDQRSGSDRAAARAGDRGHRRASRRSGSAGACQLSAHVSRTRSRARVARGVRLGGQRGSRRLPRRSAEPAPRALLHRALPPPDRPLPQPALRLRP